MRTEADRLAYRPTPAITIGRSWTRHKISSASNNSLHRSEARIPAEEPASESPGIAQDAFISPKRLPGLVELVSGVVGRSTGSIMRRQLGWRYESCVSSGAGKRAFAQPRSGSTWSAQRSVRGARSGTPCPHKLRRAIPLGLTGFTFFSRDLWARPVRLLWPLSSRRWGFGFGHAR